MKGFPPWPGKVSKPPENKKVNDKKPRCYIFFFGTENYAFVASENVWPYLEKRDEYITLSRPSHSFQEAVDAIDDYIREQGGTVPEFKPKSESSPDLTKKKDEEDKESESNRRTRKRQSSTSLTPQKSKSKIDMKNKDSSKESKSEEEESVKEIAEDDGTKPSKASKLSELDVEVRSKKISRKKKDDDEEDDLSGEENIDENNKLECAEKGDTLMEPKLESDNPKKDPGVSSSCEEDKEVETTKEVSADIELQSNEKKEEVPQVIEDENNLKKLESNEMKTKMTKDADEKEERKELKNKDTSTPKNKENKESKSKKLKSLEEKESKNNSGEKEFKEKSFKKDSKNNDNKKEKEKSSKSSSLNASEPTPKKAYLPDVLQPTTNLNASKTNVPNKQASIMATTKKIGFLGCGNVGEGLIGCLLASGHKVTVWNRSTDKCKEVVKKGASKGSSPSDVVRTCDIIFACLSDANALKDVVFGNHGALQAMGDNKGFVNLSTVDIETTMDVSEAITSSGGRFLEAPLIGLIESSRSGQMIALVSGDQSLFEDCQSCFKSIANNVFNLADITTASKMQIVLNSLYGTTLAGLAEAMALASKVGLDPSEVLDVISHTTVNSALIRDKGKAMAKNNLMEASFRLDTLQKNIRLAINMSEEVDQPLHVGSVVNELFKRAKAKGYGNADVAAVYRAADL